VKRLGPDDSWCKKCGEPVRYATIAGRNLGVAFDAKLVNNGGYKLIEQDDGKWTATYTRLDNRVPGSRGYRQHSCHILRRDDAGIRPVLVKGLWTLIQEGV
jgi:hypothetical protein